MRNARGKRKPKKPTGAAAVDASDPYLKATRVALKNLTEADVKLELGAIARVAPFMEPFKNGTGDVTKDIKLIGFVRKLLPKMPKDAASRLAYKAFLDRLK